MTTATKIFNKKPDALPPVLDMEILEPPVLKKRKLGPDLNICEISKAFVLVVVNKKFKYLRFREGALADKENIQKFCRENPGFTVNNINRLKLEQTDNLKFDRKGQLVTDDLTAAEMKGLFRVISTGDFSFYDSFICFISSHGDRGGIIGSDDVMVPVAFIIDQFKATDERRSLAGKPKLFFTQNCRGSRVDPGVSAPVYDNDDDGASDTESDSGKCPITIPTGADVLVAYATVDGYEAYRNKKDGSWFIMKLTEVFTQLSCNKDLTDMLAIVNQEVSEMGLKKKGGIIRKQMPCFTSTLRKAVYFTTRTDEL